MAVTSNPRGPADKESVADFVAGVGARVRQARKSRAISRRILAERSGVSQRYLAQLEAGAGNISIGLLFQVASALEVEPQDLLANPTELADDWRHIAILFGKASVEQQVRALAQLEPTHQHIGKANRICLIGLRGAGKSTLGQRLAIELKKEFVELNGLIEDQAGMPVGELMALYGQEGFRRLERQALDAVVMREKSLVLAVGGGIVSNADTYRLLLQSFHTVWLKAQPEEHMERVRKQGDNRPMADNPRAMEDLRSILTGREDLYSRADCLVDTSGRSEDESLRDLVESVTRHLRQTGDLSAF